MTVLATFVQHVKQLPPVRDHSYNTAISSSFKWDYLLCSQCLLKASGLRC